DFPTDDLIGAAGVTAIPHLGASTPESEDNCAIMAAAQLTAYLERGEIKNSVNLPAAQLPADFKTRVCVIHKNAEEVANALSTADLANLVSNTRGGVTYTVADSNDAIDADAIAKIPGVLRVRCLRHG
ncbi:MAG: 3-phosphoglycerate dehydrogenase, partial [Oscillospiraceae bacterium]|nr:3-phosphoglycerate dehydrogenase [Oscillospiraceae bacterium]